MSNPLPSDLSLVAIANGDVADATPVESNFASIQNAVNELVGALSGGTLGQALLAADGSHVQYGIPAGGVLVWGTKTSAVSTSGTTFAAGADVLAVALSLTADGSSSYKVSIEASDWQNSAASNANNLRLNLDGADAGVMGNMNSPGVNFLAPCRGSIVIAPTAGAHTINVRLTVSAGTGTINAGAGGAGTRGPILVTVETL